MGMVDFVTHVISNPSNYFANPFWLQSLWILPLLLVFYLIRPRKRTIVIPSLMFLLGNDKKKTRNSLFQKLANNLFWILQTIALLLICLALAEPFQMDEESAASGSVAIVLDISASMQAKVGATTRFQLALDSATKELGSENSIVLVSHVPQLILEEGTYEEAQEILSTLSPKATGSNIADALLFAGELMAPKGGSVILISDLLNTEKDANIHSIKNTLEARKVTTKFIDVSSQVRNVGIVDVQVTETDTTLLIKNFNEFEQEVPISIGETQERITIPPQSTETFGFVTPPGLTEVKLEIADDFEIDNHAYISAPEYTKTRVLLISNRADQSFPAKALGASSQIEITRAVPPVIPKIDHDVVVLSQIDTSLILPSDIDDIIDAVKKNGAIGIVTIQENLLMIDWKDLMPMTILDKQAETTIATLENKYTEIAEDTYLDFGKLTNYNPAKPYVKDATVLAVDDDDHAIIALRALGAGHVVYYGINDVESDFKLSPDYPLFWNNLVEILVDKKDAFKTLNEKTGKVVTFDSEVDITTPSKEKYSAQSVILDETGVYSIGEKNYAVNLMHYLESDVTQKKVQDTTSKFGRAADEDTFEVQKDRTQFILFIGILFVVLELLYMKMRGDI